MLTEETNTNTKAYPNPAVNYTYIDYNSKTNSQVNLIVTNAEGTVVQNKNISIANGTTRIKIDVANLANGTYLAKLVSADNQKIIKFIVTH